MQEPPRWALVGAVAVLGVGVTASTAVLVDRVIGEARPPASTGPVLLDPAFVDDPAPGRAASRGSGPVGSGQESGAAAGRSAGAGTRPASPSPLRVEASRPEAVPSRTRAPAPRPAPPLPPVFVGEDDSPDDDSPDDGDD